MGNAGAPKCKVFMVESKAGLRQKFCQLSQHVSALQSSVHDHMARAHSPILRDAAYQSYLFIGKEPLDPCNVLIIGC